MTHFPEVQGKSNVKCRLLHTLNLLALTELCPSAADKKLFLCMRSGIAK